MATTYSKHFSTKNTPQRQKAPGKNQVKNNAGGYVFTVSPWTRLNQFLILGSEGGTYYVKEQKLTVENAENVVACIKEDGQRVVRTIVEISDAGLAVKNDPAIFALALACAEGDEDTKKAAYAAIPKVCRIGTHLFHFCQAIQDLRGWSGGLRRGVAKFYTERKLKSLEMQLVKYRQRDGWTHRDVLRLAHVRPKNDEQRYTFGWVVGKNGNPREGSLIEAFNKAQNTKDVKEIVSLIKETDLPWETLPTEVLKSPKVWGALLEKNLPMTAMLRSLGRMTSIEFLKANTDDAVKTIANRLTNADELKKARIHPLSVLVAMKTYSQGHGMRGQMQWEPVSKIVDALDEAFYLSFGAVEPTGQRLMLALDVSGSMCSGECGGMPISPREGSAAMAMVTARTEKDYEIVGFTSGNRSGGWMGLEGDAISRLKITPRQRLDDIVEYTEGLDFGGTDCALPMKYAVKHNLHCRSKRSRYAGRGRLRYRYASGDQRVLEVAAKVKFGRCGGSGPNPGPPTS
jgi:60 kDa SS-A/Ro ribonucleoprotein